MPLSILVNEYRGSRSYVTNFFGQHNEMIFLSRDLSKHSGISANFFYDVYLLLADEGIAAKVMTIKKFRRSIGCWLDENER